MIPPRFDYAAPTTLDDAIAALADGGEDAKILSGGQSLIPLLKMRLASPKLLVDINRIGDLEYIRRDNGIVRIGALARESMLESSAEVRQSLPLLADAAAVIADPLVRNLATVCGNIAHGDPANDHPAAMLALRADVVVRGVGGERVIPIDDFFTGLFETALAADEIVTELRVPVRPRAGGAYQKLERKVGDFATAGVAVQLALGEDGSCEYAGIGLTNVGFQPIRAGRAEERLRGERVGDALIEEAADLAAGAAQPLDDHRGSADYKRDLVRVLCARALRRAAERAGDVH